MRIHREQLRNLLKGTECKTCRYVHLRKKEQSFGKRKKLVVETGCLLLRGDTTYGGCKFYKPNK